MRDFQRLELVFLFFFLFLQSRLCIKFAFCFRQKMKFAGFVFVVEG